jgi:hypothetical protein
MPAGTSGDVGTQVLLGPATSGEGHCGAHEPLRQKVGGGPHVPSAAGATENWQTGGVAGVKIWPGGQ